MLTYRYNAYKCKKYHPIKNTIDDYLGLMSSVFYSNNSVNFLTCQSTIVDDAMINKRSNEITCRNVVSYLKSVLQF